MCATDRDLKSLLFLFLVRVCLHFVLVIACLFVYE